MKRSPGAAGFSGRTAPLASSRLIDAVAASLALAALSLCLMVTLTACSVKVSMAMPFLLLPEPDLRQHVVAAPDGFRYIRDHEDAQ
jgi:hypothetical protein